MKYFEVLFDISYLIGVITISFMILKRGLDKKDKSIVLFGVMGMLLGFGDSFHLVPRIVAHLTTSLEDYRLYLGVGKLITGVTMTIFYYILFQVYQLRVRRESNLIHYTIIALIIIRFIILALPGNEWTLNSNNLTYGILRNIPFAILGGLIVILFIRSNNSLFKNIGYWVIVSFVCYIIVVVGSGFIPVLGAFMMPKTVAYFIIV